MDRKGLDSLGRGRLVRLIISQAEMIETLQARVAELEAKIGGPPKTPQNSSVPPSQGRKPSGDAKPETDPKKAERRSRAGSHRPLHPDPTSERVIPAGACRHCGHDVGGVPQSPCETYDHIEIPPIRPDVTRVTLMGGICPCCAKSFKAEAPPDMAPGSPFGPNLRAWVIYLRFTQGVAFARLVTLLKDIFGLDISEGALVNMVAATRQAFARQTSLIRQRLLSGTAIASDETGLRVGKKSGWLWVFHHATEALFVAAMSRAKQVVADFLGDWRPDFWLSDRYAGQLGWAKKDFQVCLAHLIRDTQYAIDAGDEIYAPGLRHLFGRACRIGARRERLTDATLHSYARRLEADLDRLMALKPTHAAGIKLQRIIKGMRGHLFVFVTVRALEATNNGSERALRPYVTFRKITNGFRASWAAELYADIRSAIETGRRKSIGALQTIRLTLAGQPLPMPP